MWLWDHKDRTGCASVARVDRSPHSPERKIGLLMVIVPAWPRFQGRDFVLLVLSPFFRDRSSSTKLNERTEYARSQELKKQTG